jgi:hypothetical protein
VEGSRHPHAPVPRFPRLKEWVYAGAFFEYTGAAASHLLVGDRGQWAGPLIFSGFSLLSWALRPASRRLLGVALPATGKRAITWAIPIFTVTAMLVVAFFTLSKGEPPLEDGNQPLLHDGESKNQALKRRCFWGDLGRRLTHFNQPID